MKFPEKIEPKIAELFENLINNYNPRKLILFGSFAYGHPTSESDIDLLIIKDTSDNPLKRRVDVRRILKITDPDIPAFSPLVMTQEELNHRLRISDQFIKNIIDKGEVLYER